MYLSGSIQMRDKYTLIGVTLGSDVEMGMML